MLNSLEIKNFRNLRQLRIGKLERVNLLTGKNNTGKSTILEAVSLYASNFDLSFVYKVLEERGENYLIYSGDKNATDINFKAISSLFTNRQIGFTEADAISIEVTEKDIFMDAFSASKFSTLRFIKYFDEFINEPDDKSSSVKRKRTIIENGTSVPFSEYALGIEIKSQNGSFTTPLYTETPFKFIHNWVFNDNFQFVKSNCLDKDVNGKLWDNITLTEKEEYIIDALKIIEPKVERIAFIEENFKQRNPVIKVKGNNTVFPLKSMGDGINRVLTIILALVNADNGFLLIDEFENGLHYSVQEKLWEIIFKLAKELNVQVFATTHSEDCIYGFESALNNTENSGLGKLIRLDSKNGSIKQVEYNSAELSIANKYQIETR